MSGLDPFLFLEPLAGVCLRAGSGCAASLQATICYVMFMAKELQNGNSNRSNGVSLLSFGAIDV